MATRSPSLPNTNSVKVNTTFSLGRSANHQSTAMVIHHRRTLHSYSSTTARSTKIKRAVTLNNHITRPTSHDVDGICDKSRLSTMHQRARRTGP